MFIQPLQEQHDKIYALINETDALVKKADFDTDGRAIAKNISQLAGILKVHLGSEDRSLYPTMVNHPDKAVSTLANTYIKEMGSLSDEYIAFKEQYNTIHKIDADREAFKKAYAAIISSLKTRLSKEDSELYPMAAGL